MATKRQSGIPRTDVDAVMKGGSWPGEALLLSGFTMMPKGVRIALYVLLALVLIYTQLLLPNLITGRLVNDENPDVILRGSVNYWIANHRSSTEIDQSSGAWSLPMFWRLPRAVEVHVKILNSDSRKVSIPFSTIMLARLSADPIEIRAKRLASKGKGDGEAYDLSIAQSNNTAFVHEVVARILPFGLASAQQSNSPSPVQPNLPIQEGVLAVARSISMDPRLSLTDEIREKLPNPIDQASFLQSLQTRFEVFIPTQVIDKSRTFADVSVEIVRLVDFKTLLLPRLAVILAKFQQRNDFWSGNRTAPSERLENFYSMQNSVPALEKGSQPIAFLDATLFGTGYEGMLFGKTGVFYRTDWTISSGPRNGFIPYSEFTRRTFKKAGFAEVSLDRGQNFVTAGSGLSPQRLVEILIEIQKAVALVETR